MHLIRPTVHKVLLNKDITELFHANSVLTACQFVKRNSLLSRGTVERNGFKQTTQTSDKIDKLFSLWFDVFADTVDIHHRGRMANIYGPILFVIDTNILENISLGRIWVTKCNPTKWTGLPENERWFQNKADLEENLTKGTFDQMIVFRHSGGEIPLGKYLKIIVVDDPGYELSGQIDMYSMAIGALMLAMNESGVEVPIERRVCRPNCTCENYYSSDLTRLVRMYSPSKND